MKLQFEFDLFSSKHHYINLLLEKNKNSLYSLKIFS